jgi:hypothetical protein
MFGSSDGEFMHQSSHLVPPRQGPSGLWSGLQNRCCPWSSDGAAPRTIPKAVDKGVKKKIASPLKAESISVVMRVVSEQGMFVGVGPLPMAFGKRLACPYRLGPAKRDARADSQLGRTGFLQGQRASPQVLYAAYRLVKTGTILRRTPRNTRSIGRELTDL